MKTPTVPQIGNPPIWPMPLFLALGFIAALLTCFSWYVLLPADQHARLFHYVGEGIMVDAPLPPVVHSGARNARGNDRSRAYWNDRLGIYNGRGVVSVLMTPAILSGIVFYGFLITGVVVYYRVRKQWMKPRHIRGKELVTVREYNQHALIKEGPDGMYIRLAKRGDS